MSNKNTEHNEYELAISNVIRLKYGVMQITKALGYNEDCDWDKAWEWFENPKRSKAQTKAMLIKIGFKM
jgi:hypothetical protein